MHRAHLDPTLITRTLLAATVVLGLAACGGNEEPAAEESHENHAEPAAEADAAAPRVFFANVNEGDTVTSPVKLVFGAENFTIEPVGEGEIHHGAGHYHIGINAHCLPAGTVIPSAEPWVHFGSGTSEIEVQLPPGPAHLSLQVGDGEHRTLDEPGLCAMINLNVAETAE